MEYTIEIQKEGFEVFFPTDAKKRATNGARKRTKTSRHVFLSHYDSSTIPYALYVEIDMIRSLALPSFSMDGSSFAPLLVLFFLMCADTAHNPSCWEKI